MNDYYSHGGYPTTNSAGSSANMRSELDSVAAGFDKLPALSGNALKVIRVNAAGTALEASNAISIPVTSYILKGDGAGGMTTATSGTDYAPATSGTSLLKGNGAGGFSAAAAGTDYQSAQSVTGIVKSSGTTRSAATAGTDYVKPDTTSNLSAGYTASSYSAGTKSGGTFTPDPTLGNIQHYTNGGAHTLAPPASVCTMLIEIVNNGSAGTITTSGFTKVSGTAPDTTNGNKFIASIVKTNSYSLLTWQALQ